MAIGISGNRDFFMNSLNWLSQQENLIAVRPRQPEDRRLTLTADQQNRIMILTLFIIPGPGVRDRASTPGGGGGKHARTHFHAHPRRRPRGARRLHLFRRLEEAGGRAPTARRRRRRRSSPSRPTRSTSSASPTRANRRCCKKDDSGWKMIEPTPIEADPPEAIGVATALTNVEIVRVVDENATEPRTVRPGQSADHGRVQGRGRRVGNVEAGQQERDAGRDLRAEERREAGVPGVVVPGDQLQPQAVRSARQEDPEVRSRQGRFAGAREGRQHDRAVAIRQRVEGRQAGAVAQRLQRRSKASSRGCRRPTCRSCVEEKPKDLAKYGLDKPSMTVTIGAGSAKTVLEVGKAKDGETYAKDASRPMVFTVDTTLQGDLEQELRRLPQEGVVRVPAVLSREAARGARRAGRPEDLRVREGRSRRSRPIRRRGR